MVEERPTRAFRAGLKKAIPLWQEDGLIDADAAAQLWGRYSLDEDGASLASIAIYLLGALLIGGGVISLVAWNWDALPDALKLIVVTSAMLGASGGGYYLWKISQRSSRLGHALIFLGTLIFGANIGLVAQVFHIESNSLSGVAAWAVGATAMAWALRSTPIAALAVLLGSIWSFEFIDHHERYFPFSPYLLLLLFLPLAYQTRSKALFVVTSIGAYTTWMYCSLEQGNSVTAGYVFTLIASATILLSSGRFRPAGKVLGLMGVLTVCYWSSFYGLAEELGFLDLKKHSQAWWWLIATVPLMIAAVAVAWRSEKDPLALVAAAGAMVLLVVSMLGVGLLTVVVAHLALLAMIVLLIRRSVTELQRGPFWGGVLIAGAVIVSRFFEFETGLLLKGLVFLACGITVIVVGLVFERKLKEERHA